MNSPRITTGFKFGYVGTSRTYRVAGFNDEGGVDLEVMGKDGEWGKALSRWASQIQHEIESGDIEIRMSAQERLDALMG